MASSFQRFIGTMKTTGTARTNLFGVNIFLPRSLIQFQSFTNNVIALYASTVPVPNVSLSTSPYQNYGEVRTLPGNRQFDTPLTIEFYMDGNYNTRLLFEQWINSISDPNTKNQGYYDDYIGTIEVYGLDRDEQTLCTYRINEAYPKSVGVGSYSHAASQINMQTTSVTFVFKNTNFIGNASLQNFQGYDLQTGSLSGLPSAIAPLFQIGGLQGLGGNLLGNMDAATVVGSNNLPRTFINMNDLPLGNNAVINSFSTMFP